MKDEGKTKVELTKELKTLRKERGKSVINDITERKQAEELKDSEERLKTLFDYAPDAYYISDLKGNFIDGNKAAERVIGYKKEELIGRNFLKLKLLSLADIPKAAKLLAKNLRRLPTGPDEFVLNRKDNSKVIVEISTYPVKIKGRALALGIARDITERKQAEKALKESEEKYRTVFENTGTATVMLEENTVISMSNTRFERLSGYSKEEIENKMKWTDFVIPEDLDRMKKYHIARRKAGEKAPTEYEFRLKNKKGNIKDIFLKIGMIPGTKKSIASLMDITERKQAEENVRKAKDELQMIMDSVPAVIFYKDTEGRIIRANKTLSDKLKMPVKDIVGKTTEELFPREQAESMRKDDKEVMISGKPKRDIIQPYTTPEGTRLLISDKIPYKDSKGKVTGVIGLAKDITKRKQAEELFKKLFDNSPNAIFIIQDKKIKIVNTQFINETGYTEKEIYKLNIYELIHPDNREMVRESAKRMLKEYSPGFEYRGIRKSGEERWIFETVSSITYQGKKAVLGNFKDVTEIRQVKEELQESYERLKKTMDATIETVSKIVEVKDPYTAGHQQRVTQLTTSIAKELNFSPDKIKGIRIASLIHDIGKMSVPTEILSKTTTISDVEFSLIKEHSQTGYDILKYIDFSYPVAQIVLQHHERINGTGYPNKLKGDEILPEAKILGVADVVEAMSSHRPYRPALGIDAALDEISKNRGILYDPEVVDICLKLFKERGFKFK